MKRKTPTKTSLVGVAMVPSVVPIAKAVWKTVSKVNHYLLPMSTPFDTTLTVYQAPEAKAWTRRGTYSVRRFRPCNLPQPGVTASQALSQPPRRDRTEKAAGALVDDNHI